MNSYAPTLRFFLRTFFALEWPAAASFPGFDCPVDGFHRPRLSAVRRVGRSPPGYLRLLGDRKYQFSSAPLASYLSAYAPCDQDQITPRNTYAKCKKTFVLSRD